MRKMASENISVKKLSPITNYYFYFKFSVQNGHKFEVRP